MNNEITLNEVLVEAPLKGHIVEFYNDVNHLAKQVADFVALGLNAGEGVILIALPKNLDLFRDVLLDRGVPIHAIETSGRLKCIDAERVLKAFMSQNVAQWTHFEATVGSEVRILSEKYHKVRAYGEMVNVLWQKGSSEAALELERFWNRLGGQYPLCLFCAYSLDVLNFDLYPKAVSSICHSHSHSFADSVDSSFARIIQRAIDEILEPRAILPLQTFLHQTESNKGHRSAALRTILWLSQNMPQVAHQVLLRARSYYPVAT